MDKRKFIVIGKKPAGYTYWYTLDGAITSCVAAYQAIGAADYAASKVNLTGNATYNCVDGAAYPTWAAETGWTFNGTTQYLTCGVVPSSTWSFVIRFSDSENSGYMLAESPDLSTGFGIAPQRGSGGVVRYLYGTLTDKAPIMTGGILAMAKNTAYRDGTSDGTIGTTFPSTNYAFGIGARNIAGTYNTFWKGKIQAISIYNLTLTGTQVRLLTTAMAAL